MGIKSRIMTSGRKFIGKHLSLYNKLVSQADGSGATDDKVQLFAKINAMTLTNHGNGKFSAALTVHGDLETSDKIQVTIGTTVQNQGTINGKTSGIAGTVGIDAVAIANIVHAVNETITVKMEILRNGAVIPGSAITGTVAITGN